MSLGLPEGCTEGPGFFPFLACSVRPHFIHPELKCYLPPPWWRLRRLAWFWCLWGAGPTRAHSSQGLTSANGCPSRSRPRSPPPCVPGAPAGARISSRYRPSAPGTGGFLVWPAVCEGLTDPGHCLPGPTARTALTCGASPCGAPQSGLDAERARGSVHTLRPRLTGQDGAQRASSPVLTRPAPGPSVSEQQPSGGRVLTPHAHQGGACSGGEQCH